VAIYGRKKGHCSGGAGEEILMKDIQSKPLNRQIGSPVIWQQQQSHLLALEHYSQREEDHPSIKKFT